MLLGGRRSPVAKSGKPSRERVDSRLRPKMALRPEVAIYNRVRRQKSLRLIG
jgi:hypothetical protein